MQSFADHQARLVEWKKLISIRGFTTDLLGALGHTLFLDIQSISVLKVTCRLWKHPGYQQSRWSSRAVTFHIAFPAVPRSVTELHVTF